MKNTLIVAGMTAALPMVTMANHLNLDVSYGQDNNPYQLTDNLNPESASYTRAKIKTRFSLLSGVQLRLLGDIKQYSQEAEHASVQSYEAELSHKKRFKWLKKRTQWRNSVSYKTYDKSYVSKNTGELATSSSQEITDRYDYEQIEMSTGFKRSFTKRLSSVISLQVKQKDYEDFSRLNLSNYDYTQYSILNNWDWKLTKGHTLEFDWEWGQRQFDDKNQRTVTGTTKAGTDLAYTISEARIAYTWKLKKAFKWRTSYELQSVKDNGDGYYDSQSATASTGFEHKASHRITWGASIDYKDTEYLKRESTVGSEDDAYTYKKGSSSKAYLEFDLLPSEKNDIVWYIKLQNYDYSADANEYAYDRQLVETGIKVSAF